MTFTSSPALVGHLVAALTERRRALGMKAREVDERAGFTDSLCEKYECGIRVPSIQALTWWAQALGTKIGLVPADRPPEPREAKKAAALVLLSNGNGVRAVARRLELPTSTVSHWRKAVQRLDTARKRHAEPKGTPQGAPPST